MIHRKFHMVNIIIQIKQQERHPYENIRKFEN